MNDPINLQENLEAPTALGAPETNKPYYPEVSLSNPDLVNFPNSGKAVIEHEVVSREHTKREDGKGHHHRIRLKIKSIRPMGRKRSLGHRPHAAESAMRDLMDND